MTLSCDRPDATIHYTVDGAEPSAADPLYAGPFTIDRDATVRARAFLGEVPADFVAVQSFRFGKPRPADSPARTAPDLRYEYFEGGWRDVAGFAALAPVKSGTTGEITAALRARDSDFGLRFTGWIDVPRQGVYTFYTRSDDGSTLSIGDTLVVGNDGLHGSVERSGQIALAAGRHAITVLFFQKGGDIDLDVSWDGPGISRQPLPRAALSHAE